MMTWFICVGDHSEIRIEQVRKANGGGHSPQQTQRKRKDTSGTCSKEKPRAKQLWTLEAVSKSVAQWARKQSSPAQKEEKARNSHLSQEFTPT